MITRVRNGPGCASGDPTVEDQLHLLGPADVQVFANYFLEENPPADRPVKHLGEREFDLQDGELIAVSGLPVQGGEGMRQQAQPFAQQCFDLLRGECVADGLQPLWVRTGEHAVVQRLVLDFLVLHLLLRIFVPIQAELGVVGKVGTELQKERSEVPIQAVEVIMIHQGCGLHDPGVALSSII